MSIWSRAANWLDDLTVSAVPFFLGLGAAVVVGVPLGIVMGWRVRVGYALDPLMTIFYASPLVALAPLLVIFFGVGLPGKTIIVFSLAVFPFIFNACAGVRAVDRRLIDVVRSLGGGEWDSLSQGAVAERAALCRRRRAHRHRPRLDRRPGRRVLRRVRGHRLRHLPLRRPVRHRQDVRLHSHGDGDRGGADRRHPLGGAQPPFHGARGNRPWPSSKPILPQPARPTPRRRRDRLWRRIEPTALGAGSIVLLLLVWQFLPDLVPMKAGTKLFFTVPSEIAGTLWQMFATGSIWAPLGVSAAAFAVGLGLAILAGLPLGILLGRSNTLNAMLDPFITAFNATPRLVFLPLLMLWFGLGLWSKVAIVFLGALFPLLINTYEGVRNADKLLINVVRSFGAGEWDIARLVVVPNALPFIVVGLRLAIGRAVLGVVVAEFFGAQDGLGVVMVRAASEFKVDVVFCRPDRVRGAVAFHDRAGQAPRRPHEPLAPAAGAVGIEMFPGRGAAR